jgi:hypothetical protein
LLDLWIAPSTFIVMLCYVMVHHLNFVTINETLKLILTFYNYIKMFVHFNIIVMNATFKVILTLCSSILVAYGRDSFGYGANKPTLWCILILCWVSFVNWIRFENDYCCVMSIFWWDGGHLGYGDLVGINTTIWIHWFA